MVVIAADWQTGQVKGVFAGPFELDRVPMLLRESTVTRLPVDLPHNFPCGHLQLCGESDFVRARHPRRTPPSELYRTKTSQNCELERGKFSWTVYQFNPHSKALVRAGPEWPRAQKSRNRHYTPIRHII